jgi:hypothetical protein
MRQLSRAIFPLLFLSVLGCQRSSIPDDPVARMGLTETTLGRSLIEKASDFANSWMEPDSGIRFAPAWKAPDPQAPKDIVRIYAVSEFHAPATYMVAVPTRCRCVFVEPRVYENWLQNHLSQSGQTLEVSEERLLGFMLLHEAGHIAHGDPGEFDGNGTGVLNTGTTVEKQREQNADSFAVEQLKRAMDRRKDVTAWLNAQYASADLANLAFEMQQVREMRFFGSESLGTHEAFYDVGYTHPNFELRLLTVNDLISNTETSHQLLQNFLTKRTSESPVLFQAPNSSVTPPR